MRIRQYAPVSVICGEHETESVRLAAENLKRDLRRVLDCRLEEGAAESGNGNLTEGAAESGNGNLAEEREKKQGAALRILVETAGQAKGICHGADLARIRDEEGNLRREAYLLQERDGELLIVGSDRRGTIYGI